MPKVSIIIPAYNAMKYLPETLNSVWQQTFTDFEVIIINDGSNDNLEQWVSEIKDSRLRLISQPNQGLSGARNTGILAAKGEYIAFLDADDLWANTKLEKQVKCLEQNQLTGLVYCWTKLMDAQGNLTGRILKSSVKDNVIESILQRNIIGCPSSVLAKTKCLEEVGFFDTNIQYVEDWEMWIRMASHYQFSVVNEPLVYYRQHPNNWSKNWRLMKEGYQVVIEKAYSLVPNKYQYLKNRSYGNANLVLAWKAIQSQAKDFKLAANFRFQAISYNPLLIFSDEFRRLSLAIILMRYFGSDGYNRFLEFTYGVRRNLSKIA